MNILHLNILCLITCFISGVAKAQIGGETWIIEKIERVEEGQSYIDYQLGDNSSLIDASKLSTTLNTGGTFNGTNEFGDPILGQWTTTGDQLVIDGMSSSYQIISGVKFSTSHEYSYRGVDGVPVNAIINTTYVNQSVLPVALQSFSISQNKQAALLFWESEAEENFSHFEVEKSIDGRIFGKVGEVRATGTSSSYGFEDQDAFARANKVFYRLKMVDHDNSFSYSQVKSISTAQEEVKIFPNPTRSLVNYKQPTSSITSYKLLDLRGKLLTSGETRESGTIDLSSLPKGAYHLVFLSDGKAIHYDRVLKL